MKSILLFAIGLLLQPGGNINKLPLKQIQSRSPLEIVVRTTNLPPLPFPDGIVINVNTGEKQTGGPLGTDIIIQAEAYDLIYIQSPAEITLDEAVVTAADISAGVKYINLLPL